MACLHKTHSLPSEQYSQVRVFHGFSRRSGCEQTDTPGSPAQQIQWNSSDAAAHFGSTDSINCVLFLLAIMFKLRTASC